MRSLRIAAVLVAVVFSTAALAGLDEVNTDGWHTWRVELADGDPVRFYVLLEDGKPARIQSMNWHCYRRDDRQDALDHGAVAARESFEWFRGVVEDSDVDRDVRDAALFGLVESGDDEAFSYIDRILSRRQDP